MNNKKIIFGIVLFLAICFLAFTFANPLEQGDGNGTLIENGGNSANSSDKTDDGTIVKSISFSSTVKTKIAEGESVNLGATVFPSTAVDKSLTYSSSNTSVLKVDQNGVVTGVGKGTATITVTSGNGKTNTITFTVGEDTTVADNNNTNNNSNNNGIAVRPSYPVGGNTGNGSTNNGNSGNNSGNTNNGSNGGNNGGSNSGNGNTTTTVAVTDVTIDTTGFVNKLITGQSTKITANVKPDNATTKTITYKSSDTSVATVDSDGTIHAKGAGTVVITATSNNGKTQSVTLNVIGYKSSNVSVINYGNFNNLNYKTTGNVVEISGDFSTLQAGVTVTITTPTVLNSEELNGFNASVGTNGFGYTTSGNQIVLNTSHLKDNNGYITLMIPINSATIKLASIGEINAQIYYNIDWLGNGNVVTYVFDFNKVVSN